MNPLTIKNNNGIARASCATEYPRFGTVRRDRADRYPGYSLSGTVPLKKSRDDLQKYPPVLDWVTIIYGREIVLQSKF